MTGKEIYDTIVELTSKLTQTGFPKKLFETAKEGNVEEVENIFLNFGKEEYDLYHEICDFGEKVDELLESTSNWSLKIFGSENDEQDDETVSIFDPEIIDPVGFCALTILGWIDESEFFYAWPDGTEPYFKGLDDAGYSEITGVLEQNSWSETMIEEEPRCQSMSDCLVGIFNL